MNIVRVDRTHSPRRDLQGQRLHEPRLLECVSHTHTHTHSHTHTHTHTHTLTLTHTHTHTRAGVDVNRLLECSGVE